VVQKIQNALNDHSKPLKGSKVIIFGMSYKRDIDDVRESPALDVMLLLQRLGAIVSYADPHVPSIQLGGKTIHAVSEDQAADADCVVIITDHTDFDYPKLVERAQLIVDSRNALKNIKSPKIVRL
jgi:UDP-N-acetyl-D-glucosamine dehydrogenase